MICLLALIIFSILSIFSVSHRKVAKEAFNCVFKKITLRKCQTGLDRRLKIKITSSISKKNKKAGKFLYKHFEVFSWLLVILTVLSFLFFAHGVVNYALYGNCNGEDSDAFCIFNPDAKTGMSSIATNYTGEFIYPLADDDYFRGNKDAKVTIIEFGCFKCPYTKEANEIVEKIIKNYPDDVKIVFRDFPVHKGSQFGAYAAECAKEQGKYWEYYDLLFENSDTVCTIPEKEGELASYMDSFKSYAFQLDMNVTQLEECILSSKTHDEVQADFEAGIKAHVSATPTFFIEGEIVVGPKSYRTFKKIIHKKLKQKESQE